MASNPSQERVHTAYLPGGRVEGRHGRSTLRIGLLDWGLADTIGHDMWAGVADAAREQGASAIAFLGGVMAVPGGPGAVANAVYDLVTAESIDGLVIWSALLHGLAPQEAQAIYERYRAMRLPMVSVGSVVDGSPSVTADNYQGMCDQILHLVEVHGYQKVAYIRGPESDQEATDRYRAYVDVLTRHGLPVDPRLVAPGNNQVSAGTEAMILFLDERGLRPGTDFEAVAASNDNMAFGALEVLSDRGIPVPGGVALTGFDDIVQDQSVVPVTTVRYPFYEHGRKAAEVLLGLLRGEEVPEHVALPLELKVRRSCGCLPLSVTQAAVGRTERATQGVTARQDAKHALSEAIAATGGVCLRRAVEGTPGTSADLAVDWASQLLDGFAAAVDAKRGVMEGFLFTLDEMLRSTMSSGGDVTAWHDVISWMRRHALTPPGTARQDRCARSVPTLDADAKRAIRAEDLWQQARVMVGEVAQRSLLYRASQASLRAARASTVYQAIDMATDMESLLDALARELPNLGVVSCYLSLYEDPHLPQVEPVPGRSQGTTEWSRLVLAYGSKGTPGTSAARPRAGRVEVDPGEQRFPSQQLVPDGVLDAKVPHTFLVQPLYAPGRQAEQQGLVVFETAGPGDAEAGSTYEALREHISSALHRVMLVQEEARARAEAEEATQRLEVALQEAQAAQRRYVRQAWTRAAYSGQAGVSGRGYAAGAASQDVERDEATAARLSPLLSSMDSAVQQGEAVVVEDAAEGAELALPIVLAGEVIGVLGFGRDAQGEDAAWSEDDIADAEVVVAQMAQALENQRLLDEELQARISLDEQVKALDCLNDIGRRMEQAPPIPEFLEWVAARVPGAMRHPDVCLVAVEYAGQIYGSFSALEVPRQIVQALRVRAQGAGGALGERVGRVCIAYTTDHEFVDEESALLGDIARRVSGYIESQTLLEATRSNAEEFAVLYELGRSLTGQLDIDQVLEAVYGGVSRLVDATNFYIGLYDPDRHEVSFLLDVTESVVDRSITTISADEGLTGYVMRTGESLLIEEDVAAWMRSRGIETVGEPAACWLGVPLMVGDQVQGVIAVQDYTTPGAYSEADRNRMVAIASQASVAIQNARLFGEIQLRARREQILREITARVRSSTDPDTIVRTAVRELGTALGRRTFALLRGPGGEDGQSSRGGE